MTAQAAHVNTHIDEKFRKVSSSRHDPVFPVRSMPLDLPSL
jgi:hypothetical protein